ITGPAVIEEFGSTLPLHPGFQARCDPYGILMITMLILDPAGPESP
ncbi:MAG: Hydantoinase/oxoprolinase C-terminal domain, partial [Streptosporangiaceae bacterium]|nr:Hydantoinase/oxoprolinase C-terminal domain [Streptosporangiaceae bacterium]